VHDELKEFLGSDDESESDSEVSLLATGKKRKRDDESQGTDEDESDGSQGEEGEMEGSRLSQRIKRSYERTTGLKEVATADTTSTAELTHTSLPKERGGDTDEALHEPEVPAPRGQDVVSYPEDEDDELEREMLAALEDGDYDPKAEEKIAAENG
jgi:RNA polymerase II subunit A-like phosphatase